MYENCVKQNSAFESIPKSHSNQIWDFSKKETNPEIEDLKIWIVPGSIQRDFSNSKLDILCWSVSLHQKILTKINILDIWFREVNAEPVMIELNCFNFNIKLDLLSMLQ